ncbi:DUF5994 family protein [Sphaerisporangium sp. B11E5]|uniref:DUF5994 family protein n=1 Tax=Sphaerisporangium sp. B11E5 TaxID=3153563 RepID=UPI00325F54D9
MPSVDSALRLRLSPVPYRQTVADGAWWPYTRDAAAELPGLIAAVDRLLDRVTLRVGLHGDTWRSVPSRIQARGRGVRVTWSRHTDPHVITLYFAAGEPIFLMVMPTGAAGPAGAMPTAQGTTGSGADGGLVLSGPPAAGSARRTGDGVSVTGGGSRP